MFRNDLTSRETLGLIATLVVAPIVGVLVFALIFKVAHNDVGIIFAVILGTLSFAAVPAAMAKMFATRLHPGAPVRAH